MLQKTVKSGRALDFGENLEPWGKRPGEIIRMRGKDLELLTLLDGTEFLLSIVVEIGGGYLFLRNPSWRVTSEKIAVVAMMMKAKMMLTGGTS